MRTFLPVLLQQDEGYVVNTASSAGLMPGRLGSYSATKHAVVALSEALKSELAAIDARVGVSVLCPGVVATRIMEADRNRPSGPRGSTPTNPSTNAIKEDLLRRIPGGSPPSEMAASLIDAMREERFYVIPHPQVLDQVRGRFDAIEADGRRGAPAR